MAEIEYYLWSNSIIGVSMQVAAAFFIKIYIAAFVFEFCNSILKRRNMLYKS